MCHLRWELGGANFIDSRKTWIFFIHSLPICKGGKSNSRLRRRRGSRVCTGRDDGSTVGNLAQREVYCYETSPWRKVERQVKVLIKNLALFFHSPSKQFLPIPFQIRLMEYFSQIQREHRHTLLGYTDKMVTTEI
jgi:hypothetical protein